MVSELFNKIDQLKHILALKNDTLNKIVQRPDTTIRGELCYNIQIFRSSNTSENYSTDIWCVSKSTQLPVFHKGSYRGEAFNDGVKIAVIDDNNSWEYFHDYKFNSTIDSSIYVPDVSGLEKYKNFDKLLEKGSQIPEIKVSDLSGRPIVSNQFKGKILLFEFSSLSCPACHPVITMFNRLHQKYKSLGVDIFSIYTIEKNQELKKFRQKNKVEYPFYHANQSLSDDFQVASVPNFYLVDSQSKVVISFKGYSEKLEEKLSKEIDVLLKR